MDRRLFVRLFAAMGAFLAVAFWAGTPAIAAMGAVTISDNAFKPNTLTIKVGDKVTWSYPTGAATHTVSARSGQGVSFDSGNMVPGDSYTSPQAFTKTGTFIYYCKIHGSPTGPYNQCAMCGKIVVQSASAPPPTLPPTPTPKKTTPAPTRAPTPAPTIATHTTTRPFVPVTDPPTPSPTPTATPKRGPETTLVQPSFAPIESAIGFGEPKKSSDHGALLGIAVAATGIAIGGGILIWYRLRGPA